MKYVQHLVHDVVLPAILPTEHAAWATTWPSFSSGVYPLSTLESVITAAVVYLSIIFTVQRLLKDDARKPFNLSLLFQIHNAALSIGSLILLLLMVEEIAPIIRTHGFLFAWCAPEAWTPRIEMYYIVNYYFKYIELIDTLFLALKKKKLEFLHVYHHAATAALCYTQLVGRTSISWFPIVLNLWVHVAMYYYYFQAARGNRVWWKRYLTTMQITQFVLDLIVIYFCLYVFVSHKYLSHIDGIPRFGNCAGEESAGYFGAGIIASYLVLFIQFYLRTYGGEAKGTKSDDKKAAGVKDKKRKK